MRHILFLALFFFSFSLFAQTWHPVGSPGISAGHASYVSLAMNAGGVPYVAYEDAANYNAVTVMKYGDSSWENIGSPGFTYANPYPGATYVSMAIGNNDTAYVAYSDSYDTSRVSVMKYNGYYWELVGNEGFSTGMASFTAMTIGKNGTLYVAYRNATVGGVAVMKYAAGSGGSWGAVGHLGSLMAAQGYKWIATDTASAPYVAFIDGSHADRITVMKYADTGWETVGSAGFSAGVALKPSIAIGQDGTPYVTYVDEANGYKATVMTYTGGSWVNVGSAGLSVGEVSYPSIAIDASGTPYVGYEDMGNGGKATVMKYSDGNWATVGSAGCSDSETVFTTITIDPGGTPYLAYEDYGNGEKATVLRYRFAAGIQNVNIAVASFSVSPNPSNGSFTLHIKSIQKESATIIITNMLGEKVKQFTGATNEDIAVQVGAVPGVYFVSAITSQGRQSAKIEVW